MNIDFKSTLNGRYGVWCVVCITTVIITTAHFEQWKEDGRSGVWLHLPLPLAHLANEAVMAGFTLHHTSNKDMSIVLSAWLEKGSVSRLPHYATHYVGVSGDYHMIIM